MTDDPIILIWREKMPAGSRRFCLRGVRADGSFYGTFECYDLHRNGNLEGQLTATDNATFHETVAHICDAPAPAKGSDPAQEWQGQLAWGRFGSPLATIILDYRTGDEQHSPRAAEFLRLVSLMRPYVEFQIQESFRKWPSSAPTHFDGGEHS